MAAKGTILITGANGGLGSATVARILSSPDLASDYHGVYTVRRAETATALKKTLESAPSTHGSDILEMDLSRLSSVRDAANAVKARVESGAIPPIRALILNAGYQENTEQSFSPDGFDMSFQCNHLSHWLLTLMLLGSMDKDHGRIVIVGSWMHNPNDSRNNLQGLYNDEKWKVIFHDPESLAKGLWSSSKDDPNPDAGSRRYGAGKLCQVMTIFELQKRLDKDPALSNISVLGLDPGAMPTDLLRRSPLPLRIMIKFVSPLISWACVWLWPNGMFRMAAKSAGDLLRLAFDTKTLGDQPKAAYINGTDPIDPSSEATDPVKGEVLWKASIGYAKLKAEDTVLASWE